VGLCNPVQGSSREKEIADGSQNQERVGTRRSCNNNLPVRSALWRRKRGEGIVRVIKQIPEHYAVEEVEFGRVYSWRPASVMVECRCGKRMTLKRWDIIDSMPDCECGEDHTASIREEVVVELLDEDYETHHHPWRYWHPPKDSGIPF
jgi:hypothetical protein